MRLSSPEFCEAYERIKRTRLARLWDTEAYAADPCGAYERECEAAESDAIAETESEDADAAE